MNVITKLNYVDFGFVRQTTIKRICCIQNQICTSKSLQRKHLVFCQWSAFHSIFFFLLCFSFYIRIFVCVYLIVVFTNAVHRNVIRIYRKRDFKHLYQIVKILSINCTVSVSHGGCGMIKSNQNHYTIPTDFYTLWFV